MTCTWSTLSADDYRNPTVLARESATMFRTAVAEELIAATPCVLARGTLPKTPSGKIQRFRCRALLDDADEAVLERVPLR